MARVALWRAPCDLENQVVAQPTWVCLQINHPNLRVKTGTEVPRRLPKHHHLLAASKAKDILLETQRTSTNNRNCGGTRWKPVETCAVAFHFQWFPMISFKLQAGSQWKPMPLPTVHMEP